MKRQIAALIGGTAGSYLIGRLMGLDTYPFFLVTESEPWLSRTAAIALMGIAAGAVTALISWKHTPGLPGMAYALALAALGIFARPDLKFSPSYQAYPGLSFNYNNPWISSCVEAMVVLCGFLLTYMLAWAVDTQIVFRGLPVKPPPKQIDTRITITRLLPCAIVIAVLGAVIAPALPMPSIVALPISFAVATFISSLLFKTRSTLWYSAPVPSCLAAIGLMALSYPQHPEWFALWIGWSQESTLSLVGTGAAGAICGHWLWVRSQRNLTTETQRKKG